MARFRRAGAEPLPEADPISVDQTDNQRSRKDLIQALGFINPGINDSSTVEHSEMVLMDENRLVSYNDEIAVSHFYPIGFKGGVRATELIKLLKKLPSDNLEFIESDDGEQNQLIIRCDNVEAGFFVAKDISIPDLGLDEILGENNQDFWFPIEDDFCPSVNFCLSSASLDVTKGMLVCLNIQGQEIVSCDNFRATKFQLTKTVLPKKVVLNIPRNAAKELLIYNPKEFAYNDSWIHFRNDDGTVFSVRAMVGDYPNVKALFNIPNGQGDKIEFPSELIDSLGRVEVLAKNIEHQTKGKLIQIEISKDLVICKSEGAVGWVKEKIKTKYDGPEFKFNINPILLVEILGLTQIAIMTESSLIFTGEGFSHVVALVV